MGFTDLLKTAWYSIRAYKLRIFLTMIGIIIGVSSVSAILAVGEGLSKQAIDSLDSSNINTITINYVSNFNQDEVGTNYFDEEDILELSQIDGVEKVEKNKEVQMFQFEFFSFQFFDKSSSGSVISHDKNRKILLESGRNFTEEEAKNNEKKIILGYNTASGLFADPKDAIGYAITIPNKGTYEVIGVRKELVMDEMEVNISFDMDYDSNIVTEKAYNELIKEEEKDEIRKLNIIVKNGADAKEIGRKAKNLLKERHPEVKGKYQQQSGQEVIEQIQSVFGGITKFVALVSGISLLVGGIGVMNIMYVSVTERRREIGIRRAIGAKPRSILLQFLVESIFITGVGGIIGILIGFLFSLIIGQFLPFKPVMTPGNFIFAASISIITGIIFGLIPAYKAAKLDPIKAIYQ